MDQKWTQWKGWFQLDLAEVPLLLHWWLYWLFPSLPQVNQEELAKVSQALRVSEKVRHDLHLELDEAVDAMDATRLPQPEAAVGADVEEMVTCICSMFVTLPLVNL